MPEVPEVLEQLQSSRASGRVAGNVAGGGGGAALVSQCGIGVELVLNANDGRVSISYVHRDRGAWQAGVYKDNRLLKVGNANVSDVIRDATPSEALDRVAKLLKGEEGSREEVQVEYYSSKAKKYLSKTVSIIRK